MESIVLCLPGSLHTSTPGNTLAMGPADGFDITVPALALRKACMPAASHSTALRMAWAQSRVSFALLQVGVAGREFGVVGEPRPPAAPWRGRSRFWRAADNLRLRARRGCFVEGLAERGFAAGPNNAADAIPPPPTFRTTDYYAPFADAYLPMTGFNCAATGDRAFLNTTSTYSR